MVFHSIDKFPPNIRIWTPVFLGIIFVFCTLLFPSPNWNHPAMIVFYFGLTFYFLKELYAFYKIESVSNDLHPYYTKAEVRQATRYYIPTRFQDTAPSQLEEPGRTNIELASEPLIPMLLGRAFKQQNDQYFLVLADSGMGKTTFMINLYLTYQRQLKKEYQIKLIPLAYKHLLRDINKVENKKDTILLLDALDEDPEAVKDYTKRIATIIDKTEEFRNVLITCRTQFFPAKHEVPHEVGKYKFGVEGGEHYFRRVYISVFNDEDIKAYLHKRYPFGPLDKKEIQKANHIVKTSPNLMMRPMLLANIEDLVIKDKSYKFSYQIYETLIEKWIYREANKAGIKEKHGSKEEFKKKLKKFSQDLAIILYQNREDSKVKWALHKDEQIFAESGLFQEGSGEEKESIGSSDWRNRSLLNRDGEGYYKFSHFSIFEYFLALEAYKNFDFYQDLEFKDMETTDNFFSEMLEDKVISFFSKKSRVNELSLASINKKKDIEKNKNSMKHDKYETIVIDNIGNFDLKFLKYFGGSDLKEIIIYDYEKFNLVYKLYLYLETLMNLRNQREWLERRERLELRERLEKREHLNQWEWIERRGQRQQRKLLKQLEQRVLRELLEQHELQKLRELKKLWKLRELREKLEQKGWRERRDRLEQQEWWERWERKIIIKLMVNLGLIKETEQSIDSHLSLPPKLIEIKDFLQQCRALEKSMPSVKFYY